MEKLPSENSRESLINIELATERLLLKPISLKYKEVIFKEFTDKVTIFMWLRSAEDISETEEFIKTSIKGLEKGSNSQLVVLENKSKEFLGCAGLHHIDRKNPELGIWIKESAHGNKYGREAIVGLVNWAEKNLDYDYILYPVDSKNIASRKIPESLGGKIAREYDAKNNGKNLHLVEYRIYKKGH